jgi:hypothetical protein
LARLDVRATEPKQLAVVHRLAQFLEEEREGWPPELRAELAVTCARIVARDGR